MLLESIGNQNPQFFRELKGRLKARGLWFATGMSLVGQLLLMLVYNGMLPSEDKNYFQPYTFPKKLPNDTVTSTLGLDGIPLIDWHSWWLDIFVTLSTVGTFFLLVTGVYLIINDIVKEQQRGTLNFVRLSPQSGSQILWGKILGVPSLIYAAILVALPLHLWAALQAQVPASLLLGFYGVVGASTVLYFSGALLWGVIAPKGNLQVWVGSGAVLFFLWVTLLTSGDNIFNTGLGFTLINPLSFLYSLAHAAHPTAQRVLWFYYASSDSVQPSTAIWWYGLELRNVAIAAWMMANYTLWSFGIRKAFSRVFHNPSATFLSKKLSYALTACLSFVSLGFIFGFRGGHYQSVGDYVYGMGTFVGLSLLYSMFLGVMAIGLLPSRQMVQDWSRFLQPGQLWSALCFGEKSPALLALLINVGILSAPLALWVALQWQGDKLALLAGWLLTASMLLIYAVVAQLILLTRWRRSVLIAGAMVLALIVAPLFALAVFRGESSAPFLFFFTVIPFVVVQKTALPLIALGLAGQWTLLGVGGIFLTRKVKQLGTSASQPLFTAKTPSAITRG